MFEKWFGGNNKKENKPSVDGVAHIDGSFEDSRLPNNSQEVQDRIDLIDDNKKKKDLGDRGNNEEYKDFNRERRNTSNERRKEKLGERNSGIPRGENLVEEHLSSQEISDEHLDALMEQEENAKFIRDNFYPEEYDEHDEQDEDLNKAA